MPDIYGTTENRRIYLLTILTALSCARLGMRLTPGTYQPPEKEITARNERLPDTERMRITRTRNVAEPQSKPDSKRMTARMPATSRIPVSKATWAELSNLKEPGETYDHLLENMIEKEKKRRLFEDMDRIEKSGKLVAMKR